MKHSPKNSTEFKQLIDDRGYGFLDFGCSKGASLKWAAKSFGIERGLGIDIDDSKVNLAVDKGFDACVFNILEIPSIPLVDFVVISHMLEHVHNLLAMRQILLKACAVSRKFVHIRQPYFDADGYLFSQGLKLFYSDWTGHPNPMSSLQFYIIFRDLKDLGLVSEFSISAKKRVLDSSHPAIHPIQSPVDQHHYCLGKHGPKVMDIKFDLPVFEEIVVNASIPGSGLTLKEIQAPYQIDKSIFIG